MWHTNQTPAWRESDHYFLHLNHLPFLSPYVEEEKRKHGVPTKQRRGTLKQGFLREERSDLHLRVPLYLQMEEKWTVSNSNLQSSKSQSTVGPKAISLSFDDNKPYVVMY